MPELFKQISRNFLQFPLLNVVKYFKNTVLEPPGQADCWRTNYVELSATREATSCVATRKFPSILWNLKAHYRVHKSSPPVPIPSHTTPHHPHSVSTTTFFGFAHK
jgi:hypothetical protein